MAGMRHYLDYNASAPLRPAVREVMLRAFEEAGNPSSVHAEGRRAHALIERAREQVAALVGARARDVIFTSGGSEANNTVMTPSLRREPSFEMLALHLMGATEHASVLSGSRFPEEARETIPVGADGVVDLDSLDGRLRRLAQERAGALALVSLQAANSETGVIQPLATVAEVVHRHGGLLHVDAVQAAGKMPVDMAAWGADVITLSAHKIGGPKGVGAFVTRPGVEVRERLVRGGGQEGGYRAGTENVAGIAGFGTACALAREELADYAAATRALRDGLEARLRAIEPAVVFFGAAAERLPNTSAFAIDGLKAETLLMLLDLEGMAVSSGSACSSGKVRRSHVLTAMGVLPSLAEGALRVSFGWASTEADVESFATAFHKVVGALISRRKGLNAA